MSKILPCPFCGKTPILIEQLEFGNSYWEIVCCVFRFVKRGGESEQLVIDKWNTRYNESQNSVFPLRCASFPEFCTKWKCSFIGRSRLENRGGSMVCPICNYFYDKVN